MCIYIPCMLVVMQRVGFEDPQNVGPAETQNNCETCLPNQKNRANNYIIYNII